MIPSRWPSSSWSQYQATHLGSKQVSRLPNLHLVAWQRRQDICGEDAKIGEFPTCHRLAPNFTMSRSTLPTYWRLHPWVNCAINIIASSRRPQADHDIKLIMLRSCPKVDRCVCKLITTSWKLHLHTDHVLKSYIPSNRSCTRDGHTIKMVASPSQLLVQNDCTLKSVVLKSTELPSRSSLVQTHRHICCAFKLVLLMSMAT